MGRRVLGTLLLAAAPAVAGGAGGASSPAAVARRVVAEILAQGHYERAAELYAPDFVNHGRTRDVDLSVDQAAARGWRDAFPDLEMWPEAVVAEGELVAVLWRARGTNTGAGNGLPATGRRIDGRGITVWRVVDGRIREEWSEFSQLALMQQLGLVPGGTEPPPASPSPRAEQPHTATSVAERERNRALVRSAFEEMEVEGTRAFRALVPDLAVTVQRTVAEDDLVAIVYEGEGTNTGAALGHPARGKRFRMRGMSLMRVAGGRIAEEWSVLDQYQALDQLGLLPSAQP